MWLRENRNGLFAFAFKHVSDVYLSIIKIQTDAGERESEVQDMRIKSASMQRGDGEFRCHLLRCFVDDSQQEFLSFN